MSNLSPEKQNATEQPKETNIFNVSTTGSKTETGKVSRGEVYIVVVASLVLWTVAIGLGIAFATLLILWTN